MARGHDNGTTILLGLKDYKVREVWGGEEKVVVKAERLREELNALIVAQVSSMDTVCASREKYSIPGVMAKRFTFSFTAGGGSATIVSTLLLKAGNWCGHGPGLPDRLNPRPYKSSRTETSVS